MKLVSLLILALTLCGVSFAQDYSRDLSVVGSNVCANGIVLERSEVRQLYSSNHAALEQYQVGKRLVPFAYIFTIAGGVLLAYELVSFIANEEVHQPILIAGGIGVVVGLGIRLLAHSSALKSVELYENSKGTVHINVGINTQGIGIALKF